MKTIKTAEMERVFTKLRVAEKPNSHHRSGFIVDESGRKLFPPVYFSKGKKDLGVDVVESFRKALLLKPRDFEILVSCRMSRSEYLDIRLGK